MNRFKMISVLAGALLAVSAQAQVTNGLISKYYFNNGNANADLGGTNATVNGATLTNDRFGGANKAYHVNQDAHLALPANGTTLSSTMTVSLWARIDSLSPSNHNHAAIYVVPNNPTMAYFSSFGMFVSTATNQYGAICQDGALENAAGYTTATYNAGQWQHLVMAMDNDSLFLYVDGARAISLGKGFLTNYSMDSIRIGVSGSQSYYGSMQGAVDDIRIYNRVLTAAEVDTLFNEAAPIVGVEEVAAAGQKIAVFPNPTTSSVQVNGVFDLALYDVSGRLVKMANAANRLDLTELQAGMYVLAILDEKGLVLQRNKIVKQ